MRFLLAFALTALTVYSVDSQEPKKDPKDLPPIPTVDLKRTDPIDYSKDIAPIVENKCLVCHSGNVVEAKFDKTDPAIFKAKHFVDKVDEIWNLVREEAIKAQGGRGM